MADGVCPGCGARAQDELDCQAAFDQFLALEFSDPAYGTVHLLTVACYMIQHGQYSDAGLDWIAARLKEHLEDGLPADAIRRGAQGAVSQDQRDWKVTRRAGDPPQTWIPWSMSILDVARQQRDAQTYQALVRRWARSVLAEMQPLLGKNRK